MCREWKGPSEWITIEKPSKLQNLWDNKKLELFSRFESQTTYNKESFKLPAFSKKKPVSPASLKRGSVVSWGNFPKIILKEFGKNTI